MNQSTASSASLSAAGRPARTPAEVVSGAAGATDLADLDGAVSQCRACPRLVAWREEVAVTKRASFRGEEYWGRPVPGFGPPDARIAILGLAPAAHGGNRTGRIFTGDRSGDVLFAALHRVGLANQPTSVTAGDGLALVHTRIFAAVRCAPPENKPTPAERDACAPWLHRELELISPTLRVVVALGAFAWAAWWPAMTAVYGVPAPVPRPAFGHAAEWRPEPSPQGLAAERRPEPLPQGRAAKRPEPLPQGGAAGWPEPSPQERAAERPEPLPQGGAAERPEPSPRGRAAEWPEPSLQGRATPALLGSYHVSQQNTFTGRLTPAMLDEVLIRAKVLAGLG